MADSITLENIKESVDMGFYATTSERTKAAILPRMAQSAYPRSYFVRYGLRFLSPELGRFLSRDPIGGQVKNLFIMVLNNVVNQYDYLGLQTASEGFPAFPQPVTDEGDSLSRCKEINEQTRKKDEERRRGNYGNPSLSPDQKTECEMRLLGIEYGNKIWLEFFDNVYNKHKGCPALEFRCECCDSYGQTGSDPVKINGATRHPVRLCYNNLKDYSDDFMVMVMKHEATHVLQHCYGGPTDEGCMGTGKAELEAAYCSGACKDYPSCLAIALGSVCARCSADELKKAGAYEALHTWFDANKSKMCFFEGRPEYPGQRK